MMSRLASAESGHVHDVRLVKMLYLVTFTMSDSSIDESNHGGLSR